MATAEECSSWVEVDLRAIGHNLSQVRWLVGEDVRILAVLKANAYGHGADAVGEALSVHGVNYFGVTTVDEGVCLRRGGLVKPILVFTPPAPDQVYLVLRHGLIQTVQDFAAAQALSREAQSRDRMAKVHVKVDTGMGRLGVLPEAVLPLMHHLTLLPNLQVEGIYTHFAEAYSRNKNSATLQLQRFLRLCEQLKDAQLLPPIRHCANSSALLDLPESHLDMVRVGTLLYGEYPSRYVEHKLKLKPTWQFKTRVVGLRVLPRGTRIGYGGEYVTRRTMRVAILPAGYAEGLTMEPRNREPSLKEDLRQVLRGLSRRLAGSDNSRFVVLRGERCRILGRLSMQQCSVDVSHLPEVSTGDPVIVQARRTAVPERIQRVYLT